MSSWIKDNIWVQDRAFHTAYLWHLFTFQNIILLLYLAPFHTGTGPALEKSYPRLELG